MIEKFVTVELDSGLQARPAAQFVQMANRFSADVFIGKEQKKINGKSIMGLMSLAIISGEQIKLIVNGNDEEKAVTELVAFITAQ